MVGGQNIQRWVINISLVLITIIYQWSLTSMCPLIGVVTPSPIIFENSTDSWRMVKEEEDTQMVPAPLESGLPLVPKSHVSLVYSQTGGGFPEGNRTPVGRYCISSNIGMLFPACSYSNYTPILISCQLFGLVGQSFPFSSSYFYKVPNA